MVRKAPGLGSADFRSRLGAERAKNCEVRSGKFGSGYQSHWRVVAATHQSQCDARPNEKRDGEHYRQPQRPG